MRTFDGRHPSWRSAVHLLDDGRIRRCEREVGRFEFENDERTLVLRWERWDAEILHWDPERQCFESPDGDFTLREVEEAGRDAGLLVGVLACRHEAYRSRRERCLSTWIPCLEQAGVTVLFLVGVGGAVERPRVATPAEHGRRGLELWLPCGDEYDDLPAKMKAFTGWAIENCRFRYLFKCDDDTYVVPRRLIEAIPEADDYVGYTLTKGVDYACGGGGYFLSRRAASIVARSNVDEGHAEDLRVGEVLHANGIPLKHDHRFLPSGSLARRPGPDNDLVTDHKFGPTWDAHERTWAETPELYHPFGVHAGLLDRREVSIPRILHTAWLDDGDPPQVFGDAVESWRRHHAGWDVRVHDRDAWRTMFAARRFERAEHRRSREEVFCLEMLYREGGVWIAPNVECRAPIDGLLGGVGFCATSDETGTPTIDVVGARPRHPIVAEVVAALASTHDTSASAVAGRFLDRVDVRLFTRRQFPLDRDDVPIGDRDAYAVRGLQP